MPLTLRGLADRECLAQQSDPVLEAKFSDRVVGLPLQLFRSLHCYICAVRHSWSPGARFRRMIRLHRETPSTLAAGSVVPQANSA
jgi:hypothetical protein